MEQILLDIVSFFTNITSLLGPLFGVFIIIIESIIPVLPLAAFISLNMMVFGLFGGFVISWFATVIGCLISYFAFKNGFSKYLYKHIKTDGKASMFLSKIKRVSFPSLVLLIAMPFTPSFAVNIAAGLSKMDFKKFLFALLIGKPFMIYFWGYIGKSLIESIVDPISIIRIFAILVVAYAISKLIQLKFNIKE